MTRAVAVPAEGRSKRRRPAAARGVSGAPAFDGRAALALAAIVLAGLALRLFAWKSQPYVTVDGTEYVRFAEALLNHHGFVSIFPPGYPLLIAAMRLVVLDRVASAALVSLVCGVALPPVTWWLGRRALGARWGLLPAALVALHPELARFSTLTMSESAYLLVLYAALALAAGGRALGAGLGIGAAFAIRPEALLPAAALAVGDAWRARRATWRPLAAFAAGFLVLAIPCWLWFHATLGVWTPTPKLGAVRAAVTDWRSEERRLRPGVTPVPPHATLADAARELPHALAGAPANALVHGRSLLALWPLPLLLLSLAGLVRRRGLEAVPLLHLLALPLLGLSGQPRFVLSALPALAILATLPLARAAGRMRAAGWALAAAGVVWLALAQGPVLAKPFEGWLDSHQHAGEWLAGASDPGDPVMDRKPYVAFYAQRPYRVMPDTSYDAILSFAVTSGVRWLVVDQRITEIYRRQLEPLLYDPAFRDRERRVELAYVGGREIGFGIGIFRVLRPGEAKSGRPPVVRAAWLTGGGGAP
ncbi:MAG TPA: hypothetical protein VFK69_09610 [Candidatus Eisenbacteria bacterium]|nr:hypothetical protein [Candidatus Eisenbacteria bacterium]